MAVETRLGWAFIGPKPTTPKCQLTNTRTYRMKSNLPEFYVLHTMTRRVSQRVNVESTNVPQVVIKELPAMDVIRNILVANVISVVFARITTYAANAMIW